VPSSSIDCERLMRAAGDAIIAVGPDGSIVLWTGAAERIFGYTEQAALGRPLDLIVPERYRSRHWRGFREAVRSGQTQYATQVLRVPAVGDRGRSLSIAFTVALLSSPVEGVEAVAAIVRDETSRWREERVLRERVSELEAEFERGRDAPA
jgi:PAS domain S-box-containing protein